MHLCPVAPFPSSNHSLKTPKLQKSLDAATDLLPSQPEEYLDTEQAWLQRSFRVINQRRPLLFYFFSNATVANGFFSGATLAAASNPIPFTNYNEPTQVHLALTQSQGCCPIAPLVSLCLMLARK